MSIAGQDFDENRRTIDDIAEFFGNLEKAADASKEVAGSARVLAAAFKDLNSLPSQVEIQRGLTSLLLDPRMGAHFQNVDESCRSGDNDYGPPQDKARGLASGKSTLLLPQIGYTEIGIESSPEYHVRDPYWKNPDEQ